MEREFDENLFQSFSFDVPNINSNSVAFVKARVAARASSSPSFIFSENGTQFMDVSLGTVSYGYLDDFTTTASAEGTFSPSSDNFNIDINFNRSSATHKGWLNSLEICTFRELKFDGGQLNFRKALSGEDYQSSLLIKNATLKDVVWNVTDVLNIKKHDLQFVDSESVRVVYDHFSGYSDEKFIIFDGTEYKTPNLLGSISNQNLHGETDFEMLIVCHPNFTSAKNLRIFITIKMEAM